MPPINKIGLVFMLERGSGEEVHPLLSSIFMEAATGAIDRIEDVSNNILFRIVLL